MSTDKPTRPLFLDAADIVAQRQNADVLFVNAGITRNVAAQIADLCEGRARRPNILCILITSGGDAHAAYQIARCLQNHYESFTLFLTGYCKSAGTLVAIGARELVVTKHGELGPLDVQMSKPDELIQRQSGLTATAALSTLHEQAFEAFEHFFLSMVRKSGSAITTRTATNVAVQLVSGLFAPIYQHVDPMHVGEAGLALQIAQRYGQLLSMASGNLKEDALDMLTAGFPSHDFVIDYSQIQELFNRVRVPNENERVLANTLGVSARIPSSMDNRPIVAFLSTEDVGPKDQALPGMEQISGRPHEEHASRDEQVTDNGGTDRTDGGRATPAAEPGAPAHPHVAAIGPIRAAAAGRGSKAP